MEKHWILLAQGTDRWWCYEFGDDSWGSITRRRVPEELLASRLSVCPDYCVDDDDNGSSRIKQRKLSRIR